jgi:hypothetical protein
MTGNRGRPSHFQLWVAVPVSGLVAGAGLAALTAQGLDQARADRTADVATASEESDPPEEESVDGTEEPPVEEPVDPSSETVDGTVSEQTPTDSEPAPPDPLVETVG